MSDPSTVDPRVVRRKVAWRILPLIFLLYIISYLDRANVGFAKDRMQEKLNFSKDVFGDAVGIFFIGYLLLEIPGALIVERWSARKWFTRILITWGCCSMGMALVQTPNQFYIARFLLGLAEAGFFPGVIVYFAHWFPRKDRARALGGLVLGVPFSLALGARVSGWLLQANWFGLDGWQWVFLIEGLPAVLMGFALPFLLTDRPRDAKWLTPAERDWLETTLEAERNEAAKIGGSTLKQALRKPTVWLLALGILATNIGGYILVFWMPTTVNSMLLEIRGSATETDSMNWLSVIYACGFVGVLVSGQSSDRTGDRKWHCVTGQVMSGLFLIACIIPGQTWGMVFFWLCLAGFFVWFWPSPFWTLPSQTLSASTAAVSIGFINMSANFAGSLGSPIVGRMNGYRDGLLFAAICFLVGGAIIAMLHAPRIPSAARTSGTAPTP